MDALAFENVDRLNQMLAGSHVNWPAVGQVVRKLRPVINEPYGDGTILSELILDGAAFEYGEKVADLVRIFLENGFVVQANNGMNGGQCLHDLCWAFCDLHVLDAAKLLLDAGADPLYRDKDFEEAGEGVGVMGTIEWKRPGFWIEGDYVRANLFETYRAIIECAQNGGRYSDILPFFECENRRLKKAACTAPLADNGRQSCFRKWMVLWFDALPLIVQSDICFVVDPTKIQAEENLWVDLSDRLRPIIGSRLRGFTFVDPCTAKLRFENGYCLTFGNHEEKFAEQEPRAWFALSLETDEVQA